MLKYWWIFILFVTTLKLSAQTDTISISGMYYHTNIYVYNPSVADSFSVNSVIINKDTITEELNANGIELDLSTYEMEEGDRVSIQVIYSGLYAPVIVNPQALMPPVKFKISKPKYSKDQELKWIVRGVPGDYPIIVEQYKWNSWRQIATIDPIDTVANNLYKVKIRPHSGKNILRVKSRNIKGEEVVSRESIISDSHISRVVIQNKKFIDEIVLSSKTEYEIYDMKGDMLTNGYDRYIDIVGLEKGKYLLFFDNQIQEFKKK
jgi:hypothetical protein